MSTVSFDEIVGELQDAIKKKGHPFRLFTLGTVGLDRMPRLRTVVLRNVMEDLKLTFYSDRRSKKIMHIKENNRVSMLFYHPAKQLQFKIEGVAAMNTPADTKAQLWDDLPTEAKKNYTTTVAPGNSIINLGAIAYLENSDNFCVVEVNPFKVEYLKLEEPHHIRIRFSKTNTHWEGEFLVP